MTDIEQYAQRYAERIEAALVGACPRAVIEAEALATVRYATRLATRACEMAGGESAAVTDRLVEYEPTPLPDGPTETYWLRITLESGAEVSVGKQPNHPHGGIGLMHEMRNTQPDTGQRTRLRFSLTPEAALALVALYAAHGLISEPHAPAPDGRCPECIRRDSRVRWHDDGSVWYCPVSGCANHADAELGANGKEGAR